MATKHLLFTGLLVCVLVSILVCGCTQQPAVPADTRSAMPTPTPTREVNAGMPNPASVYCGQIGGTLVIKKDSSGNEYGMCTFPNGTSCEEWALYRGEGCKSGMK